MIVTISDTAAAALAVPTGAVAVLGPGGVLLGHFVPAAAVEFPEFDDCLEEANRLRDDPDAVWITGDEVVRRLRVLPVPA